MRAIQNSYNINLMRKPRLPTALTGPLLDLERGLPDAMPAIEPVAASLVTI